MANGLGLAGIMVLMISFGIPFVGNFLTLLALLIVAVGALFGEKAYAIATTVIAAIKLLFLSPSWMLFLYSGNPETQPGYWFLTVSFLALPIVAIIVRSIFRRRDEDA